MGFLFAVLIVQPTSARNIPALVSLQEHTVTCISQPGVVISVSTTIISLQQRIFKEYQTANLKTKILIVVILYLAISLFALFLIIMITRTRKNRRRKQAEKAKTTYQEELTNFLFGEENQPYDFTGINHSFNRDIFVNELLSLHNNLHGETATRLRDLYFNLGFYKDSLTKVNKRRWDIKAKGFREVAQMDVKDAIKEITHHINSKNPVLRMEAQVALVKLTDEDPLHFLDDLKYELSLWEQVNIVNTLDYHQITIESFQRWLMVQNDSVVSFAAKMTGVFKHSHAAPALIPLLEHPNAIVRLNAIEALGRLEMPEYLEDLKRAYTRELPVEPKKNDAFYHLNVTKNRKAVVKAISVMATQAELPFLTSILETDDDFDILFLTTQTVASFKPGGMAVLNALFFNASADLKRIIENVKKNQVL